MQRMQRTSQSPVAPPVDTQHVAGRQRTHGLRFFWDGPAGDGPHLGPLNKCKDSPKSWKPLDSGTAMYS